LIGKVQTHDEEVDETFLVVMLNCLSKNEKLIYILSSVDGKEEEVIAKEILSPLKPVV
jgi:hypothetical protein